MKVTGSRLCLCMFLQTAPDPFARDRPYEITHRTNGSHWCAHCWHWVVDCDHLVWPLRIPHTPTPGDSFIRSFAYDPVGRRLEIFYRWKSAAQFQPVTAAMFRQIASQTDVHSLLAEWIKQRRVSWKDVRTERKIVASMLCGFRLVVERTPQHVRPQIDREQ